MSLANKLFCRITGKSGNDENDNTGKSRSKEMAPNSKKADEVLKQFIAKSPRGKYTFDSERDAPQSELCRTQEGERQKECVMIQMHSTRLFQAMQLTDQENDFLTKLLSLIQDNGFFCVLPIDPSETHIECTPKPL